MTKLLWTAAGLALALWGCGDAGEDPSDSTEALSTCSPGYHYAGYGNGEIPAVGNAVIAKIKWNGTTLASGHTAAFAGVENEVSGTLRGWIQAGIEREYQGDGLRLYIEYQESGGTPSHHDMGPAVAGTIYTARIAREGTSSWTASIGGHSLGANVPLSANHTTITAEDWNTNSRCNAIDVNFSGTSPYGTANMFKIQGAIYYVSDVTSNGWRSH